MCVFTSRQSGKAEVVKSAISPDSALLFSSSSLSAFHRVFKHVNKPLWHNSLT